MAILRDVVAYLCSKYPHKDELSKARLTKMVYLADWRSALVRESTLTSIEWKFNHYGPYVQDVVRAAQQDPSTFEIETGSNYFGTKKEVVRLRRTGAATPTIGSEEAEILDFVIELSSPLNWPQFISLVYSTYPVRTQARYSTLDLVALAKEYLRSAAART